MAKRMTDEEIVNYINSKSITQDQYVAPTVQTHVDTRNRVPAMAQVAQTVKPTQTIKSTQTLKNNSSLNQNNKSPISTIQDNKDIRTVKTETKKEPVQKEEPIKTSTVNSDGYEETNKKYGDYKYQDYANKKNYKIYTKDNKAYYFDEKRNRYVDMDEASFTSKEQDKKDYEEAVKQGFKDKKFYNSKGEQVQPSKVADQVALDSLNLTDKEKEKYKKSLIKQEQQKGKKLNFVRRSGTGIDAITGAYENQILNPNSVIQKNVIQPISNADRIYESGKLNNELALEWYNKMEGKKNNADEAQRKIDIFNRFNQDVASGDIGLVGNSIQNLNTQVESLKNQGIAATAGGLIGAGVGSIAGVKSGDPVGGAAAGMKLGSKAGYTLGSTPYMYKLEAGNSYKDLKEMGVSDKKAKKVARAVGAINAAIESGESIIDLLSFQGAGKIASDEIKNSAAKQMKDEFTDIIENLGEKNAKNYLEKLYGSDIAENVVKTYGKNIFSEALEEGAQETTSVLGERYATDSEGIKRDGSKDLQRIGQAAVAGGGSALVLGIPTSLAGNTASYFTNKVQQLNEIQNKAKSGQISYEQANQQVQQVNNGTYEQNRNLETIANQQVQQVQNALQAGQISIEKATQEIQAINNALRNERETINAPKADQQIERFKERGGRVEDTVPEGFVKTENATTAPKGYTWYNNGKSRFGGEYENVLVKDNVDTKIKELRKQQKEADEMTDKYSTLSNQEKARKKMRNAYETNAEIRRLIQGDSLERVEGGLTEKELKKAIEKEKTNYIGKEVVVDGQKGKITDRPRYGKYPIELEDGTTITATKDEITPANDKLSKLNNKSSQNTTYTYGPNGFEAQQKQAPQQETTNVSEMQQIRNEVEEKTGKTMSKHIETSSKATGTVKDIKNMDYDTIVYDEKSHKNSEGQALRELEGNDIDTNVNDIHAKFRGTERLTNVDSAKITEMMKQTKSLADEAKRNGNNAEYNKRMEQFRTLKGDYAVALSESGQFTEYAKVIKELDPETQIDVLNKFLEREQRRGNKKYENVKLNENLVEEYKKAQTDEERDTIIEKIKDDVATQIKITASDKLNEFRFLSMLGNLKTHNRNIIGNVGMYSLQSFKDGVAAIGEDIYNKTSKNGLELRTKTLKPATKEVSNFVNEKVDSFMKEQQSKYNESQGLKGDLERRTKKFSDNNIIGKALNLASNINSKALDFEDRFFSSAMTKQAMKGFLTANGIETDADIENHPELVAQALDYALFKGKEATFHQDSTTATAIRNFKDKLYTGSGFSKLGGLAIDSTLPFVSTPANIAKTALEYTPIVGFGNINKQFQNAPKNMKANVFIDSLSKQFSGGALMAVGAYLASKGLVKGSGSDDKEDKTEASLGNASYSIKIGNSTYDLSWLSPTAIPFFEGVEVFNAFKKANSKGGIKATDTADLIDTMFGTLNPMTDMSVLQSVERIITSIAYGGNAVKSATSTAFSSYLQQYIPTLLSQFAQIGDSKQRNTNTGGNVLEKTYDQIRYKIPLARNTLPEKVDVWGNANKTASNIWQRGFEALLSPANRKDYKVDKTTKELERLAEETDDTAMLPTIKNKSLKINKNKYTLKGKDYVDLQKTYGKTAKDNLDKLIKSDSYKTANDIEKQSMVRKLYDYASYKAKENYAKSKGINFDSGNQTSYAMVDAFDIPYEKYVENKVSGNEGTIKMLDKLNKAGLSEAQKGAVMNYFNRPYYVNEKELYSTLKNSNLSGKQKELIKAKYEKFITDSEREKYQRADNIGVDYDLYTKFRSFVSKAKGDSRTGGQSKKQKIYDWIQSQNITRQQKDNLYNDYINNQGIFSYYK